MNIKHLSLAAAIVLVAAPVGADEADAEYLWAHPDEVRVAMSSVAFGDDSYGVTKNESIFMMSYFNEGWVLMFSIFHIDHKLFDRWGMYALISDPDGNAYWKTATVKEKYIEIADDHLGYSDGASTLEGENLLYRLVCDFDGFTCDLTFSGYIPAWKPGTGREEYTEDGRNFQYKAVFLPWAKVEGTLSVDGREISVLGHGYGEKTLFINPFTRHQPYLHALRLYTPFDTPRPESLHFGILEPTLSKAYDFRKLPRLVGIEGDTWLFTTRDYIFEPIKMENPEFAQYEYPTQFKLFAEANGYILDGIVSESVFFHFTDIFDSLPGFLKRILLIFFKRPVYFRYVAEFIGTLTDPDGTVRNLKMKGPYEYIVSH